jgi:hypothetical protein
LAPTEEMRSENVRREEGDVDVCWFLFIVVGVVL